MKDEARMASVARDYFHELFQAKESVRTLVLNAIKHVITNKDNIQLMALFRIEEFDEAMFSMQSNKCPGQTDLIRHFISIFGRSAVLIFLGIVFLG